MTRMIGIIAACAVVAIGAWMYLSSGSGGSAATGTSYEFTETASEFGLEEMTLGNADAPVTIIEYASYTCPHCGRFHNTVYKQLKADYIDTGKVKFVYREVFFDRPGLWASMVARCGGTEKFHGITELIYKDQAGWSRAGDPAAIVSELGKIGRLAGLDSETLDACMKDAAKAENLTKWEAQNLAADGVDSTPSFVINGQKYTNMAYPDMQGVIDAALGGS